MLETGWTLEKIYIFILFICLGHTYNFIQVNSKKKVTLNLKECQLCKIKNQNTLINDVF